MFQRFHQGGAEPVETDVPGAEEPVVPVDVVPEETGAVGTDEADQGVEGAVEPVDSDEDSDEDTDEDSDEDTDDEGAGKPTGTEETTGAEEPTGIVSEIAKTAKTAIKQVGNFLNSSTSATKPEPEPESGTGTEEEVKVGGGGEITPKKVKNITADDFNPIKTNIKNLDKEVTKYFNNTTGNTLENILTTGLIDSPAKGQKIREHVFSTKVADLVYYSILTKSYLNFESKKPGLDNDLKTKYGVLISKYTNLIDLIGKVKENSKIPEKRKKKIAIKIDKANRDSKGIGTTDNIFIQFHNSKKDFLYRNNVDPSEYIDRIKNREKGVSFKDLDLKIPTVIFQNSYSTAWLLSQILFIIMNKDTFKNAMAISDKLMDMSADGVLENLCDIMTKKNLLKGDLKTLCNDLQAPGRPPRPQTPVPSQEEETEPVQEAEAEEDGGGGEVTPEAEAEEEPESAEAKKAAEEEVKKAEEDAKKAQQAAPLLPEVISEKGVKRPIIPSELLVDIRKQKTEDTSKDIQTKKTTAQPKLKVLEPVQKGYIGQSASVGSTLGTAEQPSRQGGAKKSKKNKRGGSSKKRKTMKKSRK
jgi:hypothetical protein